jgi:hypothetical protein
MQRIRLMLLGVLAFGWLASAWFGNAQEGDGEEATAPTLEGCEMFPADNIWNVPVNDLPVHELSSEWVENIGFEENLHPDFGSGLWEGAPIGIPFNVVDGEQAFVEIVFDAPWGDEENDPGPYPIPPDAIIEGNDDQHVLVLEKDNCMLYEMYYAVPQEDGSWTAYAGAVFDLKSHDLRTAEWTSADAAGLPILPGLVRYDEVEAGEIRHALRFTAPDTQRAFVWPARHYASDIEDEDYPPMGARFRLRTDFDMSEYSPEAQVILRALQTYGMILSDNGSPWFLTGVPDERWDNDVLAELKQVTGADFEAVDVSELMLDPDSGQVRPAEEE